MNLFYFHALNTSENPDFNFKRLYYMTHYRIFKQSAFVILITTLTGVFPSKGYSLDLGGLSNNFSHLTVIDQEWGYTHISGNETDKAKGARNFIANMADQGIGFLSSETLSQKDKTDAFSNLLSNSFDMNTIGRFALGRYWRTANTKQKKEYLSLFEQNVIEVYAQRFSEYNGQRLKVDSTRADNEKDTIVYSTLVSPKGPDVSVDWRVRYKNNQYKVVDIIVEGVSMSVTQRSDFSAVIQRNGGNIESLLNHLRGTNNKEKGI